MELLQIIILALVQGFTEFLPISSSAHLILSPYLLGYSDQGLAFDVAVHLGTLMAVMSYFRKEVILITGDWFSSIGGKRIQTANSRLGWAIILGTVPVVIAGLLMKSLVEHDLRSPMVIACTTLLFGLLLWWADSTATRKRHFDKLGWRDALIIGLFQAIALIPGTSRSGITMTAALMLGFTREAASRFSFLLAIPTIMMSSILVTADLVTQEQPVNWSDLILGLLLAFTIAYATIHYFLRFIEKIGMLPFVIYRILLAGLLFVLILA